MPASIRVKGVKGKLGKQGRRLIPFSCLARIRGLQLLFEITFSAVPE